MDIRPAQGRMPAKLAETTLKADARPKATNETAGQEDVDRIDISDQAREARKVAGWTAQVRAMDNVRTEAMREAGEAMDTGKLASQQAVRQAAQEMIRAKVV